MMGASNTRVKRERSGDSKILEEPAFSREPEAR
jgi:hypothetical protein